MVLPFYAMAQVNLDGLDENQIEHLKLLVDDMRSDNPGIDPRRVIEYRILGQSIGAAISAAAKELKYDGELTAFIETEIGQTALFFISWEILESRIMHGGFAILFLIICVPVWIWSYKEVYTLKFTEHDITINSAICGLKLMHFITAFAILLASVFIFFTY